MLHTVNSFNLGAAADTQTETCMVCVLFLFFALMLCMILSVYATTVMGSCISVVFYCSDSKGLLSPIWQQADLCPLFQTDHGISL